MSSLSLAWCSLQTLRCPCRRTGPSVCGLAAHLQGGLWPAGLWFWGKEEEA